MLGRKKKVEPPLRADLAEKAGSRLVKVLRGQMRLAERHLAPDETVVAVSNAGTSVVVLTDRRIVSAFKDMFDERVDITPLGQVSGVVVSGRGPVVNMTLAKPGAQVDFRKVGREFAEAVQAATTR